MTNSKNNVMTNIAKRAVAKAILPAFLLFISPSFRMVQKNFASSDLWIVLQNYPIRFVEILSKAA